MGKAEGSAASDPYSDVAKSSVHCMSHQNSAEGYTINVRQISFLHRQGHFPSNVNQTVVALIADGIIGHTFNDSKPLWMGK